MESPTHEPDWNRSKKGNSGRKSANHPPIQRSGSKLEVLPPEDFETILYPTNSTVQTLVNSESSPRLIQSAGSDGRRSCTGELRSSTPPIQRSSSEGRLTPGHGDRTTRKQVVLPTVKRNFEKHGLPIDGMVSIQTVDQQNCSNHHPGSDKHVQLSDNDGVEMPKAMEMKAEELISKLKMTEEVGERLQPSSKSQTAAAGKGPSGSNSIVDSYYISHTPSIHPSDETLPSSSNIEGSIAQTESSSASVRETERKDDTTSSSSDESEEEEKAPFELMGEFLEAVMDEDYETADKLCKMIMMYEPDNSECKQFQPLIEEMLKREREAQLWGSDDSDDDDDDDDEEDDSEDEDDDDDDDDDEEGSDEGSESSSEESTEEGSSESEEENEDTAQEEGQR
ncbi:Glutamate-rich protein 2 [Holothuria leucospilota]|uniref:Glutamate-rich protein 2 n=1 Tax=Holothuria leucospilota TaxID=206669 RepID=A0A9Q1H7G1_HOLLE|nr:Glutamate-rich protein 2 [Holothuria leucospilota]